MSNLELLVEAVTLYHMIIEGMLALTGQHFIIEYNEDVAPCRASSRASTTSLLTSTGMWPSVPLPAQMAQRDDRYRDAIQRTLVGAAPPPASEPAGRRSRASTAGLRRFAMKCLERRLKVIGLTPAPTT